MGHRAGNRNRGAEVAVLGDSLKRRRGKAPKGERPLAQERPASRERSRPRLLGPLTWPRWVLLAFILALGSYGVGYLLSTRILFPPPDTAGEGIPVPDLYGQTRADAEAAVRVLGLEVGSVREMRSMGAPAGQVLAQDPLPGQQLFAGGAVALGVSVGPPELHVPPVAGLSEATARDLLESVGFDVAVQQARSVGFPAGVVTRAEPAAGTPQLLPAEVTLIVSAGSPDVLPLTPPQLTDTVAGDAP